IPAESEAIVADHGAAHGAGEAAAAEAPVGTPVKSPMVGVFYEAPSPEAEPFVQEGQEVKKGQVLCIIEAMKLMNEIAAEQDGVVTRVCVKNGDIVEFGQPLLYIR
ncbi:MAG: acetyl-CoA carboxylase biotin carboxyl carrier protein, partial [Firmicutes bacterium]|nr:acetyl-CoA carboxylase biotin carboxyl carrier protein [Bacillota bacterium]